MSPTEHDEAGDRRPADIGALLAEQLAVLQPTRLEVIDDSARHAGHAGARAGGHYRLLIVSPAFAGLTTLQRHRRVFDVLADLMRSRIHALSITALTPDEMP